MNAKPIIAVYEKFKHLDKLFSDETWLGTNEESTDGHALRRSLYDMWQAIKEANNETSP